MAVGVNIRFGAIVTGFVNGLGQASAAVGQFTGQLNSNLTAGYAAADRSQRVFDRGLGRLSDNMKSFGRQASILTAGLALIGATSFKSFAEIDSLKRGLTAVTGSTEAANSEFAKLRVVAALPGIGLSEAAQGSIRLQAVGFSANLAREALLQFGNAVATTGGGKSQLDQITFQLGQLAAKGKVLSQDLRPIIEAAPAIAPILNKAFGSVDPEIISGKLKAAGKTSKDFVEILIGELGKLPRVSGGPKIAMENFGDSVQIAGAAFGEAADKALNLTGKINSLGSFIGRAADGFATLGPGSQTAILGVVGLAAAIGPLSLGIGAVINLIPTFTAGLGTIRTALLAVQAASLTLVTTVGAVAVAFGAIFIAMGFVGHAIDQYDAKLETSADRAKLFADVNNQVSASIAGETTKLNALLSIARDETISKEARIKAVKDLNAISPQYLGNLRLETINTAEAAKAVAAYSNALVLKAKVQVLSQRAAEAQVKADEVAAKSAKEFVDRGNFSADVLAINVKTTFKNPFNGDLKRAQDAEFEKLGKDRKVAAAQLAQNEANVLARALEKAYVDANKSGVKLDTPQVVTPNFNLVGNESDLKKAKARLKELREQIFAGNKAGNDTSGLEAEAKALNDEIKVATGSTRRLKAESDNLGGSLTTNERLLKLYTKQLKEQGESASQQLKDRVRILTEAVAQDKLLAQPKKITYEVQAIKSTSSANAAFDDLLFDLTKPPKLSGLESFQREIAAYRQGVTADILAMASDFTASYNKIPGVFGFIKRQMADIADNDPLNAKGLSGAITNAAAFLSTSFTSAGQQLAVGFGDILSSVGEGIGAGKFSFKKLIVDVISLIADAASNIGKAMLLVGIPFLSNPATLGLGLKQIATGGAIIVAAGAAKGLAQQAFPFANGGLVYGPTLGLVGEGRGTTRSNPEVIAPLDKLKGMIGGGGGTKVFIAESRISMGEFVTAFEEELASRNVYFGR